MYVLEDQPPASLVAVVAHELGHACTMFSDLWRRFAPGTPLDDGWAREFAADWYAYKWGFGRALARHRKERDWMHHGPGPGQTFTQEFDGVEYAFRVTRSFVVRPVTSP